MKLTTKRLVGIAVAFVFFVCAVISEEWIRRSQVAELPIAGLPIAGAEVSGSYMPDFLWAGQSWWIEIETDKPLVLTLDEWTGRIPVGVHSVYSNHDHTNTGQYGNGDFWGFPESVSIQIATP